MLAVRVVQIEQMMTEHGSTVSIDDDDQQPVETTRADQDLIEALLSISIHMPDIIEAGQAKSIQIKAVNVRPDVQDRLCSLCHISHRVGETRLKFFS